MEFYNNRGRRLETLADWRDHAGPVSGKQWAEGRSARELARAWIEGDAATQVSSLLAGLPVFDGLVLERGIAYAIRVLQALRDAGLVRWVGKSQKDPRAYWEIDRT